MPRFFRHHRRAFTLVEMLVSIAALTLFILIVTRLLNSASTITTLGNKHMDADSQGRSVLDRMAVDFGQMIRRSDVDYFAKRTAAPNSVGGTMVGNDQIAFYSQVPGYYPSSGSQSPVSLVSYRVNSDSSSKTYLKVERLGKGLVWNGVSTTDAPVVFSPLKISDIAAWSGATKPYPDPNYSDPDYELIGPQVFRFEYYYLLKGQTVGGTTYSSILSYTPWDTRITGHTAINGFQDVSAIGVTIAVIDPKSRVLVSDTQLGTLMGQMSDFSLNMHSGSPTQPGDLDAQWQLAVNATTAVPRAAASAIRIYSRLFPIAR
jgi:prepilin-type N-terminal cleavage/methylation domain-containing protein